MIVGELMSRRVEWTTPSTTLADTARRMRDSKIGCLPIGEGDTFIGILTEKDFTARATAEGLNPTATTVSQIMTRSVIYCREDDSIENALSTMRDRHIHHLPVRDQSNAVVGIVSLSDLALRGSPEIYPYVAREAFQSAAASNQTNTAQRQRQEAAPGPSH
jgi:CBS-domain-containing membrane protein